MLREAYETKGPDTRYWGILTITDNNLNASPGDMGTQPDNVSNDAVRRATGRDWSEWEQLLDSEAADQLSHKEIVALLRDGGHVESEWWMQTVTVGYEKMKGLRVLGQTKDTGFQVGVSRTIAISREAAWCWISSPAGMENWLDVGAGFPLEKSQQYRLADGSTGEVRVVSGKHIRITFHPEGWPRPSTIQVRVEPKGEKTVVSFHEEHLPSEQVREERRNHFKAALDSMAEDAR